MTSFRVTFICWKSFPWVSNMGSSMCACVTTSGRTCHVRWQGADTLMTKIVVLRSPAREPIVLTTLFVTLSLPLTQYPGV